MSLLKDYMLGSFMGGSSETQEINLDNYIVTLQSGDEIALNALLYELVMDGGGIKDYANSSIDNLLSDINPNKLLNIKLSAEDTTINIVGATVFSGRFGVYELDFTLCFNLYSTFILAAVSFSSVFSHIKVSVMQLNVPNS